jgi:hypothetical protein
LLSFRLFFKTLKIGTFQTEVLRVWNVFCYFGEEQLQVFENKVLRKIFGLDLSAADIT